MDDYAKAIDLLKNRFEKADILQATHVNAVISLPSVDKRGHHAALRTLHDQITGHTISLDSAGLSWENYAPIITPIIVGKLPSSMRAEWRKLERHSVCTFKDLLNFIDEEAEGQEYAALTHGSRGKATTSNPERRPNSEPIAFATAAQLVTTARPARTETSRSRKRCPFCNEEHFAIKCKLSREKKMGIVDADKRCVRCLGRNHASADCRRAQPCRTCGEPHHTALCPGPKTPAPAAATTRDSTVVAPTLAATAQVFGDIFLKTATVLIDASSGPHRTICLVDDGSQRSFMRRELAEELGLPVEGQEMIAVQAFGSNEATTPEMLKR